jgi:ADP-ribose pyrophosphatase YjhB (NUDIX family)
VYAAVVLERLPIVRPPPPEWEAEYYAWAEARRLQSNFYKEYPAKAQKSGGGGGSGGRQDDEAAAAAFSPVPVETAADGSGDVRTMKRRLRDKLVLLVRQQAECAPGLGGGGSGSAGSGKAAVGGSWAFPHVKVGPGETLRGAAERALSECLGAAAEAFFIGNAPMAHYPLGGAAAAAADGSGGGDNTRSSSTSSSSAAQRRKQQKQAQAQQQPQLPAVFFMLAQAVNDPWDAAPLPGFASDHAWLAADELPQYVGGAPGLADLARRML